MIRVARGLISICEDVPITSPDFWQDENECTDELLSHVFRSSTSVFIPLLKERISCLREAGKILYEVCGIACRIVLY